ncbi:MAG: LysR family transcriptional regulator [Burkholderiales bacterium]
MKMERNLDLQLLACLDALIAECSVTRAAERMGMSQPGMSSALARLRRLTNDVLLVRTAQGMVPTPRARELALSAQAGMRAFEEVLGDRGPFDPAGARGTLTVATADFPGMLIIPRLMERLCAEAPGLTLHMRLPDPSHIREWLTEGHCDLAIGHFPQLSDGLRVSLLFDETLVCVASRNHPAIGDHLSAKEFVAARHVIFGSPFAPSSLLETRLDALFAEAGMHREVGMRVSSILMSPYVVAQSPLLAILPRVFARHYASFLPLKILQCEFALPGIDISMVWHERSQRLSMHTWMRGVIREVVAAHVLGTLVT